MPKLLVAVGHWHWEVGLNMMSHSPRGFGMVLMTFRSSMKLMIRITPILRADQGINLIDFLNEPNPVLPV